MARPADDVTPVHAAGRGGPWLNWQDGQTLSARYESARTSLAASPAGLQPLSLASADLDMDGFPDLVVGYAGPAGGAVILHFGDPEAFGPEKPETLSGIARGRFPRPFLPTSKVVDLPGAPDFLTVGDFDRDGRPDILAASRGVAELYLLSGAVGAEPHAVSYEPRRIPLPGSVTALVSGEKKLYVPWPDVVVAVSGPGGAELLVFDTDRGVLAEPTRRGLPVAATSLHLARLDEDRSTDLAIVSSEGELLVLHGDDPRAGVDGNPRDPRAGQLDRVELPFRVAAIAVGDFIYDRDARMEIAALGDDGTVRILARGPLDTRAPSAAEVRESRRLMAEVRAGRQPLSALARALPGEPLRWEVAETTAMRLSGGARAGSGEAQPLLLPTLGSGQRSQDLLVRDPQGQQLRYAVREDARATERTPYVSGSGRADVGLDVDGAPVAILSMRLTVQGVPGIVVLREGRVEPAYVILAPLATFTVTKTADTNDGTCNADCSLREAVVAANAAAGADIITFAAGLNGSPIQLTITGDDNASAMGDLDINSDLTITGNGSANTIIQGSSNASFASNMGDKCFGVNQDGTFLPSVSISGLTVRWFRNDIPVSLSFTMTGGGMDIFLTGTGAVPGPTTTITNCVFDGNANANSYGGGLNVDSGDLAAGTNIYRGTVLITGSTFQNNKTLSGAGAVEGGGINLYADKHNVALTSCTISSNQSSTPSGSNGGGVNVRHSYGGAVVFTSCTISSNTAQGGFGGGVYSWSSILSHSLTITGGSITGNTSSRTPDALGGGIYHAAFGQLTVDGVSITNNHADVGTGGGGGLYTATAVSSGALGVIVQNTVTISGNTADIGAGICNEGGILTMTNGSFAITGNTAAVSGGGIAVRQFGSEVPTATVSKATITGNSATTSGGGLFVGVPTSSPPASPAPVLNVSLSRITGNTGAGGTGITRTAGTATVEKNWWGCDGFPGAVGCDSGSGTFDADPRIDLAFTASPNAIPISGSTSTVTADVTKDTNGANLNAGNAPSVLVGLNFTFNAGTHGTFNAPLTVAIPAGGTVAKTFTSGSTSAACGAANPTVQLDNGTQAAALQVQCPDLVVTKTGPANVTCGGTVTYNLTVTNQGDLAAAGVTFSDDVADCLTGVGCTGATCSVGAGNVVTSNLGAIAAAGSASFTITGTAPQSTACGIGIVNAAASVATTTVESNTGNNSSGTVSTTVLCPDLTVSKSHAGNFTQGQAGATYTITVTNAGNGPTNGSTITVTDTLPAPLAYVSGTGTGWSCSFSSPTVTCTSTNVIAALGTNAITLTVDVACNAPSSVTNNVSVAGGGEGDTSNDTGSDPTTINQVADLTLGKAPAGTFTQGQNAAYTMTVTNIGTGASAGTITVTDTLPSGLTFVSAGSGGAGFSCSAVAQTVTCTGSPAIAASGGSAVFPINVAVACSAASSVVNNATVAGGGECNTGNDAASHTTTIVQVADLTIAKAHVGASFTQAQNGAQYTLTVSNIGTGASTGTITVSDTLPAGLSFVSGTGGGFSCSAVGQLVTCTGSPVIGSGGNVTITLTVNVACNAATSLANTATVSGGGQCNTGNDTSNTDTVTVVQLPDLSLTKTHGGNFTQGQNGAVYTLTVTNAIGTTPTSGTITVTDTLPTGLSFVSGTGGGFSCSAVGQLVTCTSTNSIAAGGTAVITLTVNVACSTAGSITNTATVSGGGQCNTGNDTASDPTTVNGSPDLTLTKSHAGNFTQGQLGATYTLTVSNAGLAATSAPITVVDTLPAGLAFVSGTGTGWSCVEAPAQTITCSNAGPIASLGSSAITLTVDVSCTASGSVTNTATVSGGAECDTSNDNASDPTTIVQVADLTLGKAPAGTFTQGQNAAYTMTVTNIGTGASTGTITVTDTLPTGLTFVAAGSGGAGFSCSAVAQTVTCTGSPAIAASGGSAIFPINVAVACNASSSVVNNATVAGGGECNTGNDTASHTTTIVQVADLTITKAHVGASFTQAQNGAQYTLTVNNGGTGASTGTITVTDTLPAGLTFVSGSGGGFSCSAVGQLVTCSGSPAIAVSGNAVITLTVNVACNAATSLANTAAVSGGGQCNTANDTSNTDTVTVVQLPDLTLAKSHAGNFTQGQNGAVYTLTVTNAIGTTPTSGTITVSDTLPTGLSFVSGSGGGFTCAAVGQVVTCTSTSSIAAGGTAAITLTVNVACSTAGSITNTASVSGGGQCNTANDSASDPTTVNGSPDLTLGKTHAGNFTQGQLGAQYTLTVNNVGLAATSAGITVVDTLPAGLTFVSGTGAGWGCVEAPAQTITCTSAGPIAASSSSTITLTANVSCTAPASVTNTAVVSGGGECDTSNDTASDPTTIVQVADLTLAKVPAGTFTQGQSAAYTMTVTNTGTGASTGTITVTDTLPAGLTFVAAGSGGGGFSCGAVVQVVTCTGSPAIAASGGSVSFPINVAVSCTAPTSVVNNAVVAGGGECNTGNDTAGHTTTIVQVADLTITKAHVGAGFTQAQNGAQYTLTVGNTGTGASTGTITVSDTLPAGLTFASGSGGGFSCSAVGQTVTCTSTTPIPVSGSAVITLNVNVACNAAPTLVNTAAVSGGGECNTANDASAPDTVTVVQLPDLSLAKTHAGNFTQGQNGATYTLTVSNAPATSSTTGTITVSDTLPTGLTFVSGTGGGFSCSAVAQTVTCTSAGPIVSGGNAAITLTVNVACNAPASVTNTATVSGGGQCNTANDTATDPTTINGVADLTIAKTHAGSFTQGQSGATYTLTVNNIGTGASAGTITVSDTLPAALTFVSGTGGGFTCSNVAQAVTCTSPGPIAASGNAAITLTVNVSCTAPASITNTATVSGGGQCNTTNDSSSDPTTIVQVADLTLAKAHSVQFVQGQPASYTLTVGNSGTGPSVGTMTVSDTLPVGLTFASGSGGGFSCSAVAQLVTCTSTTAIPSGGTAVITLNVNVAINAPPSVTNTATVSGGGECNTANDSASDVTAIFQLITISGQKFNDLNGNGIKEGGEPGLPGWTIELRDGTGALITTTTTNGTGNYSFPSLGPGTYRIREVGQVNWVQTTPNPADIVAQSGVNVANVDFGNSQGADLLMTKTAPATVIAGQTLTFSLTSLNTGPATAQNVTISDTLPAGVTFVSATPSAGFTTLTTPAVGGTGTVTATWNGPTTNGSSRTLAIVVRVCSDLLCNATIGNTATTSSPTFDINLGNNSSTSTSTVQSQSELALTLSHVPEPVGAGGTVTYTINIANNGPSVDPAPSVAATLPAGWTIVSATSGTGTCTPAGNTAACTLLPLGAAAQCSNAFAATAAITIVATVPLNQATGTYNATASVTSGSCLADPNGANNNATDPTKVVIIADMQVTKLDTPDPVAANRYLDYTVTVTNNGPSKAYGVVLSDVPSSLLRFVSVRAPLGWSCSTPAPGQKGNVTCTGPSPLDPGPYIIGIRMQAPPVCNRNVTVTNDATVGAASQDPDAGNNHVVASTVVQGAACFNRTPRTE